MPGVCSAHKLASSQTQEVIFSHDPQYPLVIGWLLAPFEFCTNSSVPIARHLNGDLLNHVPQLHVPIDLLPNNEPVITCPAHFTGPTHLAYCQFALGFYFFFDPFADRLPPPAFSSSRCSSTRCKAFFKKSFSRVIWPIFRSSSASRFVDRTLPFPVKALLGYCWISCFHRRRTFSCTPSSRATRARAFPLSISSIAASLNSRVKTLRVVATI